MRATEHAPRGPFHVLERRHGLAEIVERGTGVPVERLRGRASGARRVVGESHESTLRVRWVYARALYEDPSATLDDLREAVTTLEDVERTARRVFGGAHPLTSAMEKYLQNTRAALRALEVTI